MQKSQAVSCQGASTGGTKGQVFHGENLLRLRSKEIQIISSPGAEVGERIEERCFQKKLRSRAYQQRGTRLGRHMTGLRCHFLPQ